MEFIGSHTLVSIIINGKIQKKKKRLLIPTLKSEDMFISPKKFKKPHRK